jgi:(S)-2-hydroxyglutarate dehydrogenase
VRIVPFRGEYFHLSPARSARVTVPIYPVPDPRFPFLGVHLTPSLDGRVEVGPNAVLALARHGYRRRTVVLRDAAEAVLWPGFWRFVRRHWRAAAGELWRSLSKRAFARSLARLAPDLRPGDLEPGGAGVRAQAMTGDGRLVDDFLFVESERTLHVLNAPSPAATASIRIGEEIAGMVQG